MNDFFFQEFQNKIPLDSITFDEPGYWEILTITNSEKCSLDKIQQKLNEMNIDLSEKQIKKIIRELQSEYLLYCNNDYSENVTVIDTDTLMGE